MSIEQLRREVVEAITNVVRSNILAVDFTITVEAVRAAFDAYDKAVIAANKPTFEGDEAEVRNALKCCRTNTLNRGSWEWGIYDKALALLDAKDAEIAEWRKLETATADARDSALSRAEQAEAALAEERKAMSEAASYAIEDLREWLVNYPDAYDRDTTEQAITTLSRFVLPAKPAVDPLVGVLEAAGYAVFPEDLEKVRAAIERAGGVKAVFGESV